MKFKCLLKNSQNISHLLKLKKLLTDQLFGLIVCLYISFTKEGFKILTYTHRNNYFFIHSRTNFNTRYSTTTVRRDATRHVIVL